MNEALIHWGLSRQKQLSHVRIVSTMDVDKNTSEIKKENGMMVWTCKENARKQIVTGKPRMQTRGNTKG